ncbi:MAG: glycosyltransferase family 39 protein [Oscillospiraceae bacterium]|nr:glycosyltransferase family 39 protein [Oscillospiraceae bacterium]
MSPRTDVNFKRFILFCRWLGSSPYWVFGVVFLFMWLFIDTTIHGFLSDNLRLLVIGGVFAVAAFGFWLWMNDRLTYRRAAALVMAIGLLVRIAYVLYTGIGVRQHDIGHLTPEGDGHFGYVYHFARSFSLPQSAPGQFYHPPLHHMILGLFYRLGERMSFTPDRINESLQYVTAFYSSCFMLVAYRIFKHLRLKDGFLLGALALVALHPFPILLSGMINNDMLFILLYSSAFLWLLKWLKSSDSKNTAVLALCTGLALMTKTSAFTLAPVIATVFIVKLLRQGRCGWGLPSKSNFITLGSKFALFGLISLPIGLWHPIRRLYLFDLPLGYVPEWGGDQHVLDASLFSRFIAFPIPRLFTEIYPGENLEGAAVNLPTSTLRTSLFGEWAFNTLPEILMHFMAIAQLIIVCLSLLAMVYAVFKIPSPNRVSRLALAALWFVQIAFYVYFYVEFPAHCTMNFRYIAPTLISGAGFIGIWCQHLSETLHASWKRLRPWVAVPIIAFVVMSAVFYLLV